eukprot:TRINITY_DN71033_c0_g1_i1.p1 TRINITY_DN71033_c0_g1~~TRINITY_DN71033_c0_g1_i1.p1  ORF type:complete len:531 (+),score=165.35 TRINITY_DN71033_c0_g1_i1:70-1662(+)
MPAPRRPRLLLLAAVLWAGGTLWAVVELPHRHSAEGVHDAAARDASLLRRVRHLTEDLRAEVHDAERTLAESPPETRREPPPAGGGAGARHAAAPRPPPQGGAAQVPRRGPPAEGEDDTPLADALRVWERKRAAAVEESCTSTKHFQSSVHFHDFKAPKGPGYRLPTTPPDDGTGGRCNASDFAYTPRKDAACRTFLADFRNWRRLRPMSSVLSEARTIKFIATLGEGADAVRAVIKIPQFKFMVEPYSELIAYETDRLLGVERVPPTVWVAIPLSWFRAAAAVFMPDMYVQWLECFVFEKPEISKLIKQWGAPPQFPHSAQAGENSLWVSAQLWMQGVKPLSATPLRPARRYTELLDPGSGHWPPPSSPRLGLWALAEISDLSVFDHVIGNNDRTVHKNAFGVGDCDSPGWDCKPDGDAARRPRMVYLDQGSSFYSRDATHVSLYRKSADAQPSACRFRRGTYERLREFREKRLERALFKALPSEGFFNHAHRWQIQGAQHRLATLLDHIEGRCLKRFKEGQVFPFAGA